MGSPPLPNVTGFHTPYLAPPARPGASGRGAPSDGPAGYDTPPARGESAAYPPAATDQLASCIADLSTLQKLADRLPRTRTVEDALQETLRAGATLAGARRGFISLSRDRAPADGPTQGATGPDGAPGARDGADVGEGRPAVDPPPRSPDRLVGLGLSACDLGDIETVPWGSAPHTRLLDGADRTAPELTVQDIPREEGLDPRHREVAARLGFAASYAQPLTDQDGHRIGAAVWFYDEPARPGPRQRHLLTRYLRQAAWHIANRLELARANEAVREVQRGLVERRLPRVPGVTLAVRREPGHGPAGQGVASPVTADGRGSGGTDGSPDGSEATEAEAPPCHGGAFHEALRLPEGALGLAVGTVTGSGPARTAAMGRLLAGLRAYAVMEGEDPVAVLGDLELLLRVTESARSATALFGYVEPATRRVVLASAGHPPPLVVGPDRVVFAETTLSAPLAMLACWEAPSVELTLAPGETLLLYSEGLLHRTGEPLDRALSLLRTAAEDASPTVRADPEELTGHLLRALAPVPPRGGTPAGQPFTGADEATLLAARF